MQTEAPFKAEVEKALKIQAGELKPDFNAECYERQTLTGLCVEKALRFIPATTFEELYGARPEKAGLSVESLHVDGSGKATLGIIVSDDDKPGVKLRAFYKTQGLLDASIFDGRSEQLRENQGAEIASWFEAEWKKGIPKSIAKMPSELPNLSTLAERVKTELETVAKQEAEEKEKKSAEEALLKNPAREDEGGQEPEKKDGHESSDSEAAIEEHVDVACQLAKQKRRQRAREPETAKEARKGSLRLREATPSRHAVLALEEVGVGAETTKA